MKSHFISPLRLSAFSIFISFCYPEADAQLLHIDNTHSSIEFSARFMDVTEVTGRFGKFCGYMAVTGKEQVPSEISLFIDARSINTGLKARDRDLAGEYLDCDQFPIIEFHSRKIQSPAQGPFTVEGDLTLHGKIRPVKMTMMIIGDLVNADGGREMGLKAVPLKINRKDFDVMENATGIGDSIEVRANIRVRDVRPYRKTIDVAHPELKNYTGKFITGKFADASTTIRLIQYHSQYFMSFDDDDWSWFSELRPVGDGMFKSTTFGVLLTLADGKVILEKNEKKLILTMMNSN